MADIHFNYRLALAAIENGIDKVRINPGNIGKREKVEAVVKACKERGIPIRIGVNAGSLENHLLEKYGYPTAEAMVESALYHIGILEELDFHDIIVSLKASDVPMAIAAYTMAAEKFHYPLHLGITEAGTLFAGTVKSAAGLGALLHGHRQHDPHQPERRSGRRSEGRPRTAEDVRPDLQRRDAGLLSDLRPARHRSVLHRQRGGGIHRQHQSCRSRCRCSAAR